MIGIRSITYNLGKGIESNKDTLDKISKCSLRWDSLHPHTQRINFSEFKSEFDLKKMKPILKIFDYTPLRWLNVPLNLNNGNAEKLCSFAYKLLHSSRHLFVNLIAMENGIMKEEIFQPYTALLDNVSKIDSSGFNNFRLGLSFNIDYNCPFFPFTRAKNNDLSFSIALEMVETINETLNNSKSKNLKEIQAEILDVVAPQIDMINESAKQIESKTGIEFAGFDFSLAPQISDNGSVITILQNFGIYNFGQSGTMFATAFLTDLLKELAGRYKSVGFSGVMYSLLEDLELCSINNDRGVNVEQLIGLSTMCGCGLDMVPICCDTSHEEIASLCMDIAAISCKYKKPLGARLLPIPNAKRGNSSYTSISSDADFIANTKVVQLDVNLLPKLGEKFSFRRYGYE